MQVLQSWVLPCFSVRLCLISGFLHFPGEIFSHLHWMVNFNEGTENWLHRSGALLVRALLKQKSISWKEGSICHAEAAACSSTSSHPLEDSKDCSTTSAAIGCPWLAPAARMTSARTMGCAKDDERVGGDASMLQLLGGFRSNIQFINHMQPWVHCDLSSFYFQGQRCDAVIADPCSAVSLVQLLSEECEGCGKQWGSTSLSIPSERKNWPKVYSAPSHRVVKKQIGKQKQKH